MRVRATFEDNEEMTLVEAREDLFGLSGLLYVAYLDTAIGVNKLGRSATRSRQLATSALQETGLESLRYNSPLEVVLLVSSLAGSVTLVGNSLITMFSRVQQLRRDKAAADVFVEAQGIVLRNLRSHGPEYAELTPVGEDGTGHLLDGAARAALNLTDLRVEED